MWVAPTERLKVLRQAELGGGGALTGGNAVGASVLRGARLVIERSGVGGLWLGAAPTAARQATANGVRFFLFERFHRWCKALPGPSAAMAGGLSGICSVRIRHLEPVVPSAPAPPLAARAASPLRTTLGLPRVRALASQVALTNPIDVIKTRVQATPTGSASPALSTLATVHAPLRRALSPRARARTPPCMRRRASVQVRTLLRDEGVGAFGRGMSARMLKIGLGQAVIFQTYDTVKTRLT